MTLERYLEIQEISKSRMSQMSGIPLRGIYRYVNGETQPTLDNALIIKAVTDGEVDLEDWFHETEKPRPSLQYFRDKFGCRQKRN